MQLSDKRQPKLILRRLQRQARRENKNNIRPAISEEVCEVTKTMCTQNSLNNKAKNCNFHRPCARRTQICFLPFPIDSPGRCACFARTTFVPRSEKKTNVHNNVHDNNSNSRHEREKVTLSIHFARGPLIRSCLYIAAESVECTETAVEIAS